MRFAGRLARDVRGVTAIEFAIVSPVLCVLLLGGFDLAHTLYMRSALQGAVQKAARDATLEASATVPAQTALDDKVKASIAALINTSDPNTHITFARRSFRTFSAVGKAEPLVDTNGNNKCDKGEQFTDDNGNGVWDKNPGSVGQGGASDRTLYTVTVSYPRMFPVFDFYGAPITTMKAQTILENQPYADKIVSQQKTCP